MTDSKDRFFCATPNSGIGSRQSGFTRLGAALLVALPLCCTALPAAAQTGFSSTAADDTTPPVLNCPTNLVVTAEPGQCEATVTFSVTAADDWDANPTVVCVPPSGSVLPVGRTNVLCTAWDASGNTNTCSFAISVYPYGGLVAAGELWTARESNRAWYSVASSTDGTRLVAVDYSGSGSGGQIYTSTDGGTTWTARESNRHWRSVASSADGTRLVAAVYSGQIYTSADGGTTWTARESNRGWGSVASSADGTRLVAGVLGGQIYTSTDGGTNWTARASNRGWWSVASSADGTRLVAVVTGGQIYTSTDGGTNWTARESNRTWRSAASSADGTRLVAVVNGGQIYTSTDGGTNWTARASNRGWWSVASSADGTRLVALVSGGQSYTSTDGGTNWAARESNRAWYSVASSADGTRLVAVVNGGQIYTSVGARIPLADPPTIQGAANQVLAATGPDGAFATFNVTATNVCQPFVPVTCTPPSGSLFPLGTNTVTCEAVDALGVTNTATFTVTVFHDTTPPVLNCPTNLVVTAEPGQCGATFSVTATDDWDANPTVVCVPPSGSVLPVGRTNVLCTAWDASGNTNTCSFAISVYPYGGLSPAGDVWTARESNRAWYSVASSTDGTRLVAVDYSGSGSGGQIYTSTDGGTNWTARESNRYWRSVASSADGTRLVAVDYSGSGSGGQIYTSTDGGTNWTARASNRYWRSVASSADGTRLVAGVDAGQIYTSTDGGTNWTACESNRYWYSVACSADGTRLVAVVNAGQIYTSTDGGINWTARESNRDWQSVASSADGARLVAVEDLGQICTSTDGGTNWTARASNRDWRSVASSADGTRLVAVESGGQIYTSTDGGTNWTARESNRYWRSVASSADGTRLVAVVYNGQIYTSVGPPILLADPPTILGATNQVLEATGPDGAVATFNVTATNVCQPFIPVTCTPPSGSLFPLGTNTVICEAVDGLGVTNTATFTITVFHDATPPALNCPTNLVVTAEPGQCEATVTFSVTATDNWYSNSTVVCVPPSGSVLPVGRTKVLCTAWDASGNTNSCSFDISVYPFGGLGPAGEVWTARESNRAWYSVASSADGTRLVAVDYSGTGIGGQIYTSTDGGTTWTPRESNRHWRSVASSADGTRLVAVVNGGQIYTSTDGGTNWTAHESNRYWYSVASSADGTRLVAVVDAGQIYVSTNGGTNWTARASNREWNCVASSADGTRLVAAEDLGRIYTSSDGGTNWTACENNREWNSVASSADGTRLVAVESGGQVYISTDGGTNWTARESNRYWRSVASSADGTRLAAVVGGGLIYTSTDGGSTWAARESSRSWRSVASSADGTRLVAVVAGGQIYTSVGARIPLADPPTILGATNRALEATGPDGVVATFNVKATNVCQPFVPVTCTPPSGSLFPLGTNTVTCVAVDALGVTNTATFTVTVYIDTTPPVLNCPTNLVVLASEPGQCEATVTFSVAATDDWDANPKVVCVPPSGSVLPVGRTNVLCTAWDASGNTNTCSFAVSVYPVGPARILLAEPPTILGATNQVIEAPGPDGAVATFNVTATNVCQPFVPVTCTPPSGSLFPLGTNTVTCEAVDALGVTNTATFTVTVFIDTTPPVLNCPTNLVVMAGRGQCEAIVTFSVTATDDWFPNPTVVCVPPSGSTLPVGRTNVVCTTWDARGNSNTCSFYVSVCPYGLAPPGEVWTARESNRNWISVAASADGTRLVAVDWYGTGYGGRIYTSTDGGTNWTARASNRGWQSVASSADGTRLVAVDYYGSGYGGLIYTSPNGGINWAARASNRYWGSVASSADGTRLVAVVKGGQIYTSTNGGITWTARESNRDWRSVASSADGTRLFAAVWNGPIYTSTDGGTNWTAGENYQLWPSVACSADGTRLVAVVSGGPIYTSTDGGTNWTARDSNRGWWSVASSADGNRLVAVVRGGQIYTSSDGGTNWTAGESNRGWWSVASSGDGTRLVAVDYASTGSGGQIYTSVGLPFPLADPPSILGATNQVLEATGPDGVVATFNVTATNGCQPYVPVTCTPPSGSLFPLGTNTVTCVAVDALGVTNTVSFTVTVFIDSTPPVLTCPDMVVIAEPNQCEATVTFFPARDDWDPNPTVVCVPPSGSTLPVGRTNVVCTAWDAHGNSNTCSFNISVYPYGGLAPAGEIWTAHESNQEWYSVASSVDGTRLVAVTLGGPIYTSTDAGAHWTARESGRYWESVASSADGMRLVAAENSGQIYTSTDGGTNWTARESNRGWNSLASSADGMRLVASVYLGQLYTSTDGGTNWTARESNRIWRSVASSADGTRLVAVEDLGPIYTSTDGGANWTTNGSNLNWFSVASSADGTRLVAAVWNGRIYTSTDGGANWTARESNRGWWSVASSADGTRLAAVVSGGQIYTSTDGGANWTARESNRGWRSVASSADGGRLVAVDLSENGWGGRIYTSGGSPIPFVDPPTILGATNQLLAATGSDGAVAGFSVTATNGCQPFVPVTCTPPSDSLFPLGTNTVTCVAVDALGVTNTTTFTVTVMLPVPPPVLASYSVSAPGQFLLQATGTAGMTYRLQSSTNLVNWLDRTNLLADPDGLFECLLDMDTNAPACFYRLRWP